MKKNGERTEAIPAKSGFWQSIRGKVLLMGLIALVILDSLGAVGIIALNSNNRNQEILTEMNHISLSQYENESLETMYLYSLGETYLEQITVNLTAMGQNASAAQKIAEGGYRNELVSVADAIASAKENYEMLRSLIAERGYEEDTGLYQQFLAPDEELETEFAAVADDRSWVDGGWLSIAAEAEIYETGDSRYLHFTYVGAVPQVGKRDLFMVRIGGNNIPYVGEIYVNQIVLHKGGQSAALDLSALSIEDLSNSYGDALGGLEMGKFNGEATIFIDAQFSDADDNWRETTIGVPVGDLPIQDYQSVSYEIYIEVGEIDEEGPKEQETDEGEAEAQETDEGEAEGQEIETGQIGELSAAFAVANKYDFGGTLTQLDNDFVTYSKNVVEGNDVSEMADTIRALFAEIAENLGQYVVDQGQRSRIEGQMAQKLELFEEIVEADNEILTIRQENIILQEQLSRLTDSVREQVEANTQENQSRMVRMITIILAAGTVVLLLITVYIGWNISASMRVFQDTLSQMMSGNLSVRARVRGKDEFSQFGIYVNQFLDRLAEVIKSAQNISLVVKESGEQLDGMAENSSMTSKEIGKAVEAISAGATTQAGESDTAAGQMEEMGRTFGMIVENVEHLGTMTEQMRQVSAQSARFMQELGVANEKTVEVFSQVSEQTHTTNESVQKIREATELITSIASQTNLLSLNASIEAARAGEAGRGFAVVATEIQQLAEQSNASAGIIKQIIEELSAQAELTVSIVDEVSEIVKNQQRKLDETRDHFVALEKGIETSSRETEQIRRETDICNEARQKVESVIMSLSAISERNAASTEETTASMLELNGTIQQLVDASGKLKEMAGRLETDLQFFRL